MRILLCPDVIYFHLINNGKIMILFCPCFIIPNSMRKTIFTLLLSCLSFILIIHDGYKVVAVKTNASSNDQTTDSQVATEKSIIPDLNYLPPPLLVKAKDGKMKTRHAIHIESKIRKGTLEEFRKKENLRNKKFRKSLSDEERIALSKKHQDILRTKLKTVCKQNV